MTDWERVDRLRQKGASWEEVAEDPKVDFHAPPGANAGRSLRTLYHARRSRGVRGRSKDGDDGPSKAPRGRPLSSRLPKGVLISLAVVAVLIAALVGYLVIYNPAPPSSNIVTYCGGEGTAAHYHVLLVVDLNGAQQHLPYDPTQTADIGYLDSPGFTNSAYYCSNGGIHALHTHDGSGIIHAELPPVIANSGEVPTLGNFFTIWGEPLSSSAVWTYSGSVKATMYDSDTHASKDYSSNPGSIPLYTPSGGPLSNPFPIPQGLIFNGQYGSGQSGGSFDGEIIWLNVTGSAIAALPAAEWAPTGAPATTLALGGLPPAVRWTV